MGLFDGIPLEKYDTPRGPARPIAPAAPAYQVRIAQASNGASIMICDKTPAPAEALAEASKEKLALFCNSELPIIRAAAEASPDFVGVAIEAKLIFPGAVFTSFQDTRGRE